MPPMYQQAMADYTKHLGINWDDPSSINGYISTIDKQLSQESGQRPGAESSMRNNRNAVENLFNYLHLGRDLPGSIFDLPEYKATKGYR